MFMHNKRLMYTVRVAEPNPDLATLMLEQFGGPQGELAAAMRYFTQALGEDDPGRKDLLFDIATEELSHLEIIGSIIAMLNKGPKAVLSEGMEEAMEMRNMTQNSTSHTQQILYGGGPALVNSAGVPWTAAYVDSIGCPTADMRSNIAAEARAKRRIGLGFLGLQLGYGQLGGVGLGVPAQGGRIDHRAESGDDSLGHQSVDPALGRRCGQSDLVAEFGVGGSGVAHQQPDELLVDLIHRRNITGVNPVVRN